MKKPRLAIIGSGISGLATAYFLRNDYEITIYEKNSYIGGHTNTISVEAKNNTIPIDTGFMVFNKETYPNFLKFLNTLEVPYVPTDMSFSVQNRSLNLEWNGAGLNKIFSQRRNLLNLAFWKMLFQLDRFNKDAKKLFHKLNTEQACIESKMTVAEYVVQKGYGEDFVNLFLLPMTSAIWSTSPQKMLGFPLRTLVMFFNNHGFLGLSYHHQWYTIANGSVSYIQRLKELLQITWALNNPVQCVFQKDDRVVVCSDKEYEQYFDKVVLACHADESIQLLGSDSTPIEAKLLEAFKYEKNSALLHTDTRVMPKRSLCWAAWNYRLDFVNGQSLPSTHYWMTRLQHIEDPKNQYFVSLNAEHLVDPDSIIQQIDYTHPIFNTAAIDSQKDLSLLNTQANRNIYFCGSYFKYGFHEDAFTSALQMSELITARSLW